MKEIILTANIVFFDYAIKSFNFPIRNLIRTSFWLPGSSDSTFSEITLINDQIELLKLNQVKITLLEQPFLQNKIFIGTEFRLGTFPNEIAKGEVMFISGTTPML